MEENLREMKKMARELPPERRLRMNQLIQKMEREWNLEEKQLRDLKREPKNVTGPKNMTGRRDMKKTVTAGGGEAFKHLLPERQPQKPRGIRTSGPLSTRTAGGGRKIYTYYVPWMKYEDNVPQRQGNLNQANQPYFDFDSYDSSDSSSSWTPPKPVKKKKKSKSRRKQVLYEESDDDETSDEGSLYEEPSPPPKQEKKEEKLERPRRKTTSYEDISHDGSLYGGSIYEEPDGPKSFQNTQRYAGYQRNAPYMNTQRGNHQTSPQQNNQRYDFGANNQHFSARSYESDGGHSQEA